MPATELILLSLAASTNDARWLSAAWHFYFAAFAVAIGVGWLRQRRLAGLALVPPLLSVSAVAWIFGNPFNGAVFAALALCVAWVARRLGTNPLATARGWRLAVAGASFAFGWLYPHFLWARSSLDYLFYPPTGVIPCPTLAMVMAFVLATGSLGSRALGLLLAAAGLFYGLVGALVLGVQLDWLLVLIAAITASACFGQGLESPAMGPVITTKG